VALSFGQAALPPLGFPEFPGLGAFAHKVGIFQV
jgi:hypothetical protein